jgi:hypothetical protein
VSLAEPARTPAPRPRGRLRLAGQLCDLSGSEPSGIAIYALCDPRELRTARYIGQSADPRRRLAQHLNAARLWLPDEQPWWVRSPRLRPLYGWIRELHRDEARLPVMVVLEWAPPTLARHAERRRICEGLAQQLPLLNFEYELLRRQLQLL